MQSERWHCLDVIEAVLAALKCGNWTVPKYYSWEFHCNFGLQALNFQCEQSITVLMRCVLLGGSTIAISKPG